jgi:hypothetical protein
MEEGSRRKKRGHTQPKRPPPGQRIPLNPLVKSAYIFICTDLFLQAYNCHLSLLVENLLVTIY